MDETMKLTSQSSRLQLETKDKFDALLKQALNSKNIKNARNHNLAYHKNKEDVAESLVSTESGINSGNHVKVVEVDVHDQVKTNKSFILDKFLNDSANSVTIHSTDDTRSFGVNDPDLVFIKPPVPLPRRNVKAASVTSAASNDGTYTIKSIGKDTTVADPTISTPKSVTTSSINEDQDMESQTCVGVDSDMNEELKSNREIVMEPILDTLLNTTGITIHRTDNLHLDLLNVQLIIQVHVVNRQNGEYLQCYNNHIPNECCYMIPMRSRPNNLQEHDRGCSSATPEWEETLTIHEDFNYLLKKENKTIVFFEILHMLNGSNCNKLAWAFLKLSSKKGEVNIEKQMRLQLYYPNVDYKNVSQSVCNMFHWWKRKKLIEYPSTLYVSIGMMKMSRDIQSSTKSVSLSAENYLNRNLVSQTEWTRCSYQTCKLPNKCISELPTYEEGCFIMKFSNNGSYLACAVLIDELYSVVIYSSETLREVIKYSAHQGLIYNIAWSNDDHIIVTASADCTVCVWSFSKCTVIEILPHPSFVYATVMRSSRLIATGCYDKIVRIWKLPENDGKAADLVQELENHGGYITTMCFNKKSTLLYSADSLGIIFEWTFKKNWDIRREIKLVDLRDTVINKILLHMRERRMVIHARDSTLRVIDLKTGCVLYWLHGGLNNKFQTSCSLSACGTFIVAGSENGVVHVWNIDTGNRIAMYSPRNNTVPISCVEFHPMHNMMAISGYSDNQPILLLGYDPSNQDQNDVGLVFLENSSKEHNKLKTVVKTMNTSGRKHKYKLEDVIEKIDQIMVNQSVLTSNTYN